MDRETVDLLIKLGLGAILGYVIKSILDIRKERQTLLFKQRLSTKETRYKAIILLMYAFLDYESEREALLRHRPDLDSKEKLEKELKVEWKNMTLYSGTSVIKTMKQFLMHPVDETYIDTIIEFRKDMYLINSKSLKSHDLTLK